jgi:DNA-binding NtrC family response regulator
MDKMAIHQRPGRDQMDNILIIDDEKSVRFTLGRFLGKNGYSLSEAEDGMTGLEIFRRERPLLVLLDLKMPGMDGIECLRLLKKIDATVPVIIITAHGDIPTAVRAIQHGAYDFILKPPDFDLLILTIRRAVEKQKLEIALKASFETMFGKSNAMKAVVEQVRQVAPSDFSVILQGETGTGKSFIARAIHGFSKRADGPFVAVDMGTIPENLAESELFGFEKGAFTGAERKRKGFFEISNNGTILIDELQNVSPFLQGKLLRVVEERRLFPLGSTNAVDVNVRIISATNANIMQAVKEGKIREDLFFRLGEFVIDLPPLRDRHEDIPFLAQKFFREAVEELNKNLREISDGAIELLLRYSWPGNIRELKNVVRRSVLMAHGDTVTPEQISTNFTGKTKEDSSAPSSLQLPEVTMEAEKKAISHALSLTQGNRTRAAGLLHISHRSLLRKIKQYDIE